MINWKVRCKNPYFWIGLVGVVLTAANISPETLTSWPLVIDAFKGIILNPFTLVSSMLAILGVIVDPTTATVADSTQALNYNSPKK